jgi:alpha-beta hydrolase superfamily lysophospholipase
MALNSMALLRKSLLRRLLVLLLAPALGWLASGAVAAYLLSHRVGGRFEEQTPELFRQRVESPRIHTQDGEELGAWLIRGESQELCVLLVHGNRASRSALRPLFAHLATQGRCVLAISARGHGDSTGSVVDAGWSARHDVVAGVAFLEREASHPKVLVVGISMGAAAAIFAAESLGTRVSGYLLESPYRDLKSAVEKRTSIYLPPGLRTLAYAGLRFWSPVFLSAPLEDVSPIMWASSIPPTVPTVFLSGSDDERAPTNEVKELSDRVPGPTDVVVFEGASHQLLFSFDPHLYDRTLLQLISQIEAKPAATAGGPQPSAAKD